MFLYQREELLADVGGHALTKRRVEPNDLPFIFLPECIILIISIICELQ